MNYRIYCSEYKDGKYRTPELFKPLDEVNAYSPYVSPDGNYLIHYKSDGGGGLWIIYKKNDGKNVIFLAGNAQFWVDAGFIDELRKNANTLAKIKEG